MTIPRHIGPETTGPRALPDYSRSSATVQRAVDALNPAEATPDRLLGVIQSPDRTEQAGVRAVFAAFALAAAFVLAVAAVISMLMVPAGHAPGIGRVVLLILLFILAALCTLVAVRFAVAALGVARGCVEVYGRALRIRNGLGERTVAWADVAEVESRVVHPVHGLTSALRLHDGRRVVLTVFNRHLWQWGAAENRDLYRLRRHLKGQERRGMLGGGM